MATKRKIMECEFEGQVAEYWYRAYIRQSNLCEKRLKNIQRLKKDLDFAKRNDRKEYPWE